MQAATVLINRRALRHNLQRLRELAPASKLVAVVKANAYGHGLIETARTLPMLTPLALPVSKKPYGCGRGHHATYFVTGRFLKQTICRRSPLNICIPQSTMKSSLSPSKTLNLKSLSPSG